MGEYFHGWKRKIGVAILLMTCVLAVGWIRSLTITDRVYVKVKPVKMEANALWSSVSLRYQIVQQRNWSGPSWNVNFESIRIEDMGPVILAIPYVPEDAFSFWTYRDDGGFWTVRIRFPYWSVVFPLALLSGWLLLSQRGAPRTPSSVN